MSRPLCGVPYRPRSRAERVLSAVRVAVFFVFEAFVSLAALTSLLAFVTLFHFFLEG